MTPRLARQVALLRWSCALVLGTAAAAKLLDFAAVTGFLAGQMGPAAPAAPVAAALLIAVEALAAFWLVSPRHASRGGALAAMLGLAFLVYRSSSLPTSQDCPCFGAIGLSDPTIGILLGLMLVSAGAGVALAAGLPISAGGQRRLRAWLCPPMYAAAGLVVAGVAAGVALRTAEARGRSQPMLTAAERAGLQLGQGVPAVRLVVAGRQVSLASLVDGQPTVVSFLSLDCAACRAYVRRLSEVLGEVHGGRAVLIVPAARQLPDLKSRVVAGTQAIQAVRAPVEALPTLANPTHLLFQDRRLERVTSSSNEVASWLRRAAAPAQYPGWKP